MQGRRCLAICRYTQLKQFFSVIKAVYRPPKPKITHLLSSSGTPMLKDKSSNTDSWREHFANLNIPSTVGPAVLDQIPQNPSIDELDFPTTLDEIMKAIIQTIVFKVPGMDGLPV